MIFAIKIALMSVLFTLILLVTVAKCTKFASESQNGNTSANTEKLSNESCETSMKLTQSDRILYIEMALPEHFISTKCQSPTLMMKMRDILNDCLTEGKHATELSTNNKDSLEISQLCMEMDLVLRQSLRNEIAFRKNNKSSIKVTRVDSKLWLSITLNEYIVAEICQFNASISLAKSVLNILNTWLLNKSRETKNEPEFILQNFLNIQGDRSNFSISQECMAELILLAGEDNLELLTRALLHPVNTYQPMASLCPLILKHSAWFYENHPLEVLLDMTERAGCLEGSLTKVVKELSAADHPLLNKENLESIASVGISLDNYRMFLLVSQSKAFKNGKEVCFNDLKEDFPECSFLEAVHVEMLRQQKTLLTKFGEIEAVVHNHVNLLQLIYRENAGFFNPKDIVHTAAEYGHLKILTWIYQKTTMLSIDWRLNRVIANGHLEVLKWIWKHYKVVLNQGDCNTAARSGHLEMLKWIQEQNVIVPNQEGANWAALNGHLEVLNWIREKNGIMPDQDGVNNASCGNHLEVLKWIQEKNVLVPNQNGTNRAASWGHLEVLKWIQEQAGIVPNQEGVNNAASEGHLEVLKWIREQSGVVPNQNGVNDTALNGHLEVLKWIQEQNGIVPNQQGANEAASEGHLEVLKWIREKNGIMPDQVGVNNAASEGHL